MLTRPGYEPRVIDATVEQYLRTFPAVSIEGPKWSGKTWTALAHAQSAVFLGDPAGNFSNRQRAQLDVSLVLGGEAPALLDEWQEVPALWDAVRHASDASGQTGQYILTGSATPTMHGILHSGTGRIARLRMRPMSSFESKDSAGTVSLLRALTSGFDPVVVPKPDLQELINLVVRGGWPANVGKPVGDAMLTPRAYLDALLDSDLQRLDDTRRDVDKVRALVGSLARNESTMATNRLLAKDVAQAGHTVDPATVARYLDVLERLNLIEPQPAFSPRLRSRIRLLKSAKHHFVDPSLAAAALRATPAMLLDDLETFGFLFEADCVRDLRVYSASWGGEVSHLRDASGMEVDAVVTLPDAKWAAVEIKLGTNQIDKAAENLLKVAAKFKERDPGNAPAALAVVCGLADVAYVRDDGVRVLPLMALRP